MILFVKFLYELHPWHYTLGPTKHFEIIINDTNNNNSSVTRFFCFFLIDTMYY